MNYDANNLPLGVVTITTGELRGKKFYIRDGQTIVIGRSQDADIILPISYSHVSRHHCSITYDGIHKMFFVVDTSANGVLNSEGHHLKSQANLKNGTVLWMGNSDCIITLSAEQEVQANPIRETGNVPPVYPLNQSGYAYKQVEHSPDRGESSRRNDRRHEKSMSSRRSAGIILAAVFITIVVSVGLIYRLQSSISDIPVEALLPTGDFAKDVEPVEVTEMSEDEMEEKKQSAHNHEEAPDEVLLVNNAREFYYYSALTDKEQMLYDAIMRVVQDPANEDNVIMYESDINPNSDEFADQYNKVLFCVLYDHPETFWLYNNHETKIEVGTMGTADDNIVYLWLQQPYVNYEQEITAFNHAAEEFLADIDLTASDSEIALQIHDKLIELVTYDTDVVDQSDGSDFAHTAYGALVENSRGMEHYAVCDGYSLAYEYLLQQAGIEASVIIGDAGATEDTAGGHAWNVVLLDGEWYEVDSTWNDTGNIYDSIDDEPDEKAREYYREALGNEEYNNRWAHYLYNVTTDEITNYNSDMDYYTYETEDGKNGVCFALSSVHIRASKNDKWYPYNLMIDLAPIAMGTKYKLH